MPIYPILQPRSSELFVTHPISTITSTFNWGVFAAAHLLIVVGILLVIFRPKYANVGFKYRVMIIFSGVLFFAIFAVPNLAPVLNFSRFYAITMLFLAPCFVWGGETVLFLAKIIGAKVTGRYHWNSTVNVTVLLLVILASSYFLAQSGFVNHFTGGSIQSFTLDWDKTLNLNMATSSEPSVKVNFYNVYTPDQDFLSAKWLSANMAPNSLIYADSIAIYHPLHVFGLISSNNLVDLPNGTSVRTNSFIYLRTFNVQNGFVIPMFSPAFQLSDINSELNNCNLLYTNGQSVIYNSPG